jgi:(p)ppGpp synthase/HD superfamily hydrolase
MREKLIEFVKEKHSQQVRKYTGEPYYSHVEAVALAAEKYGVKYGFEIGLCHDLLEDTDCKVEDLYYALKYADISYSANQFICDAVVELTDVFTTESFPYLNRSIRKQCEALRLHTISREAQIIKCFDLMDNTKSILQHDIGFATKYIPEKRQILIGFKKLPTDIHAQVWESLLNSEENLQLI